jgi:invasion protein IalB
VECTGDGKTLDCRAVQQMIHRETRRLLVSVAARAAASGKGGMMVLQLPIGLNLTEPIAVRIDNGAGKRQAIQTCTNVGCFATIPLGDKLVAAMRTGSKQLHCQCLAEIFGKERSHDRQRRPRPDRD